MNCCKPEQVGTKEHGKMLKRIQILEDGRVPAKEATNWKIEGQKRRIGDNVRENKAMHEENFLSSWLREEVEGKEERK